MVPLLHYPDRVTGHGKGGQQLGDVLLEAEGGGTGGGEVGPSLHDHSAQVVQTLTRKIIINMLSM